MAKSREQKLIDFLGSVLAIIASAYSLMLAAGILHSHIPPVPSFNFPESVVVFIAFRELTQRARKS